MAKDSYWFRHDSTAGRGLRMRKMAHIHGHWGKGIYWDVIEILRDQANYSFDYDDSSLQMLCDLIGCKDESKFIKWMRDCVQLDLFRLQDNKFYSHVLCENMQVWEKQKENGSKSTGNRLPKHTQSIPKAYPKHNIIEQDIIEDNRTRDNSIDIAHELLNSSIWHEQTAMALKLTTDEVKEWLSKFISEIKAKEQFLGRSLRDIKSHFVSWTKIEIEKKKRFQPKDEYSWMDKYKPKTS